MLMITINLLNQLSNDHSFSYYSLSDNKILIVTQSQSFKISRKLKSIELSEILRRC